MLDFSNTSIRLMQVHRVGNKFENQGLRLSVDFTDTTDERVQESLIKLFFSPFKNPEYFQFANDATFDNHPMYRYSTEIFSAPGEQMKKQGEFIANLLYDVSEHPSIKPGDLCVVYFGHVGSDGRHSDALGIYKIEHLDTFLKFAQEPESYTVTALEGLGLDKLDKACLILNQDPETGYKVCCADRSGRVQDAMYWKDDFLALVPRADDYHFTEQAVNLTKDFVTKQLSEEYEISKADQIALLNRSAEYFKSQDHFNEDEFAQNIFQDPGVIDSFQRFVNKNEEENGFSFTEDFDISEAAVKKNSKVFKSVLKLDKNFHIYIHGNRNMIERGTDENGKKFYKLYYDVEI
ncbi:MAG: nucleoid-associated protein [Bacteroidetes bacterium]|nr:MAG: nucleoid-associated protein [Bacteroidota bacterium]